MLQSEILPTTQDHTADFFFFYSVIFGYPLRLDADHHAHALHRGSSHCLFALDKPPALTVSRSHGSLMARARTPHAFSRRPNSKRSSRIWVAAENVADPAGQGR